MISFIDRQKKVMSALNDWGKLILDIMHNTSVLLFDVRHNIFVGYIDKAYLRGELIMAAGCVGLWLGTFADTQFFYDLMQDKDKTVAENLAIAVVSTPVFMILWFFRTRDIRQHIQQNHFNHAIENLATEGFTKESFGVRSLINLSQRTSEFNRLIAIAFESRIRELKNIKTGDSQRGYREKLIKEMNNWLSFRDRIIVRFLLLIGSIYVMLWLMTFVFTQSFNYYLMMDETVAKYWSFVVIVLLMTPNCYFYMRDVSKNKEMRDSIDYKDRTIVRFLLLIGSIYVMLWLMTFVFTQIFNCLVIVLLIMPNYYFYIRDVRKNKEMRDSIDLKDKIINRVMALIAMGILGLGLGLGFREILDYEIFNYLVIDETIATYLSSIIIGIPVLLFLWFFRSRDIRQQFHQDHFNNAIEKLATESLTKESIGVRVLINLSKKTSEFNKLITIAFKSKIDELYSTYPEGFKYSCHGKLIEEMNKWLLDYKKERDLTFQRRGLS